MSSNDSSFLVSGWDDDLQDVDEDEHPQSSPEREILWVAENNNLTRLKELVNEHPHLLNHKDQDGYTPLHRACTSNHPEIVRYLLEQGANVLTKSELLWQPLHSCCQWNYSDIASILLQNGADINALSEGMQTPLHIAASHGASYNTVQLLLMQPYIKVNLYNKGGETPFEIARRSSRYYNVFDMADPLIEPIPH